MRRIGLASRLSGVVVWAALCGVSSTPAQATPRPDSLALEPSQRDFMRGMTVSCPIWGRIWGSPAMSQSLAELAELGVQWVAIHPYAVVRRDGTVRYQPAGETDYLPRAVERVREAGVRLFWKPHLGYWGSFGWRGEIEFGADERAWRRFFDQYRAFIVDQARFAEKAGAPLFSVGIEYEATTGREAEWRRIIDEVRQVYSGRITYAANWDRIHRVPFWDALDLIGVQAYFPLSFEDRPPREVLERGWDAPLASLRELSESHGGKGVLFAEIGYDISADAAREPWKTASRDNEENRSLRRRLIEVALERIEGEPFIHGMFWWKWIPGRSSANRDFSMRHPEAKELLRRQWGR